MTPILSKTLLPVGARFVADQSTNLETTKLEVPHGK